MNLSILAVSETSGSYWPFAVLAMGIVFVILAIAVFRIHAFISLILAAVFVGALSDSLPGAEEGNHFVTAIGLAMTEFGTTAGKIAWVIALAAIIGVCLMESGAADRIVRGMVRTLGESRAGVALVLCSFFLSIPVFFDTVFFLLIPLAQALAFRLGRNYLYFVMAVCSGGVITHGLVPPTPGPLVMVETLGLNLGFTIVAGIGLGLIPAFSGLYFGKWLEGRLDIGVRESPGIRIVDIEAIVSKEDSELPSFFMSMLPVVLPVFLIAATSFLGIWTTEGQFYELMQILGNKNVAMLLGTIIALYLLAKQRGVSFRALGEVIEGPLGMAGTIILITSAGGSFGAMIRHAGVGDSIRMATEDTGFSLIIMAWLVAAIMKLTRP
ncbi:MAG: hypothetical protein HOA81_05375 [Opitutales bacterium]|nr:hypothetical protein [Opitutales bacterium]